MIWKWRWIPTGRARMIERKNEISPSTESRKALSSALSPGRDTVIVVLLGRMWYQEKHRSKQYCLASVPTFNLSHLKDPFRISCSNLTQITDIFYIIVSRAFFVKDVSPPSRSNRDKPWLVANKRNFPPSSSAIPLLWHFRRLSSDWAGCRRRIYHCQQMLQSSLTLTSYALTSHPIATPTVRLHQSAEVFSKKKWWRFLPSQRTMDHTDRRLLLEIILMPSLWPSQIPDRLSGGKIFQATL